MEAIRQAVCTFAESDQLSDDLTCVAIKVEDRQLPLARAELELRSDLTELRRARAFVRAVCSALPGTPLAAARVAALELAVNEATSNIMKHAYHGRTDQRIHLEAETFPDQVVIRLHHSGDPCDPARVPPPALNGSQESGYGLYLITQSVDDVRYYCDARGRTALRSSSAAGHRPGDGDPMDIAVDTTSDVAVVRVPIEELDASNVGEFKRDMAPCWRPIRTGVRSAPAALYGQLRAGSLSLLPPARERQGRRREAVRHVATGPSRV